MLTLNVDLGERSYPIYIGADLLSQSELFQSHILGRQVLIVSNEQIAPLYLSQVHQALGNLHVETLILPEGEQYKTLDTLSLVFDALIGHRFERSCTLLALGGGVVGDITGYAAASYQRGVNYIQVPTTLLAQVDSSVGGKTAVNHPGGKNMIGAFYQPRCVIAAIDALATLPQREFSAGLAEVIKYGLIRDYAFLQWLEENMENLLRQDAGALSYAVQRSCQLKADIVAADERENDVRALLNLGHTFGHAIEASLGYGKWLHGEAVAAGTIMAIDLSTRLGWLKNDELIRVQTLFQRAKLPISAPVSISNDDFLRLMSIDKKVQQGRMRFILLKALGEGVIADDISHRLLLETLTSCRDEPQ